MCVCVTCASQNVADTDDEEDPGGGRGPGQRVLAQPAVSFALGQQLQHREQQAERGAAQAQSPEQLRLEGHHKSRGRVSVRAAERLQPRGRHGEDRRGKEERERSGLLYQGEDKKGERKRLGGCVARVWEITGFFNRHVLLFNPRSCSFKLCHNAAVHKALLCDENVIEVGSWVSFLSPPSRFYSLKARAGWRWAQIELEPRRKLWQTVVIKLWFMTNHIQEVT